MKTLDQYAKACGDLLQSELPESIPVTHLTNDSRKVTDGSLFMAIQGSISDGREYIEQAIANGAAAICYMGEERDLPVPQLRVSNDYHAFGRLAEFHFDYPANDLSIIGVTGTNGKTTTAYLLKEILQTSGRKVGLIGTVQYLIGDKSIKADRTTPTPCRLQELMAEMRKEKVDTLVMEISSHALIQKRLGDMQVDVAVFTNLTEEHLDFQRVGDDPFNWSHDILTDR